MPLSSPAARIASGLALASVAFLAGYAASSAYSAPQAEEPIVNVNAWSMGPPPPVTTPTPPQPATCNPWDVSDIAMEEVLREMTRRGWRPPRQGPAVEAMQAFGVYGVSVDDPDAPMPRRGGRSSYIAVLGDDEADAAAANDVAADANSPSDIIDQLPPLSPG